MISNCTNHTWFSKDSSSEPLISGHTGSASRFKKTEPWWASFVADGTIKSTNESSQPMRGGRRAGLAGSRRGRGVAAEGAEAAPLLPQQVENSFTPLSQVLGLISTAWLNCESEAVRNNLTFFQINVAAAGYRIASVLHFLSQHKHDNFNTGTLPREET